MTEQPTVRVGQIWADNDRRAAGRRVKVLRLYTVREHPRNGRYSRDWSRMVDVPMAQCEVVADRAHHLRTSTIGNTVRIRVERMKPTSTGYRLVKEAAE